MMQPEHQKHSTFPSRVHNMDTTFYIIHLGCPTTGCAELSALPRIPPRNGIASFCFQHRLLSKTRNIGLRLCSAFKAKPPGASGTRIQLRDSYAGSVRATFLDKIEPTLPGLWYPCEPDFTLWATGQMCRCEWEEI